VIKSSKKTEKLDFGCTAGMGVLLAFAPHLTFGAISYGALLISGNFDQIIPSIGMVCLYSCGLFLFFPILGAVVSIFHKSWYALKCWLVMSAVAIALNLTFGLLILTTGADFRQDPKSKIQNQGSKARPTS
jgi:hypothetical protein